LDLLSACYKLEQQEEQVRVGLQGFSVIYTKLSQFDQKTFIVINNWFGFFFLPLLNIGEEISAENVHFKDTF
jgi:hypothetical protein